MDTVLVVPPEARGVAAPLLRAFGSDGEIKVILDRRAGERRQGDRRSFDPEAARAWVESGQAERRHIRSANGRRVAERRSAVEAVPLPELPRRARSQEAKLSCFRRLAPGVEEVRNVEAARLVIAFQAGDKAAFAEIYQRFFDRVYRYLVTMLKHPEDAEDVSQEVFVKALQALPAYELRGTPFGVWLFRIARNLALTRLEKQGRFEVEDPADIASRQETEGNGESVDTHVLERLSDADLIVFISRLPLAQQQVVLLRSMLGFSVEEVALVMDRTPNAVRQLQNRAFTFLRNRLRALGREPRRHSREPGRRLPRTAWVVRTRKFVLFR